jgi:amino acid transporter
METTKNTIGFWSAAAIGVGGMVGGGIFAVLGLAVQLSQGGAPLAFALAGIVAMLTAYSYAKLSVAYPSQGGTVEFLNQAFGSGVLAGSANVLLWISYVVMLSLYAYAFGSYGASFFEGPYQVAWKHVLISTPIVLLTLLNALGAAAVGKAEEWIVALKVLILLFFVAVGTFSLQPASVAPATWSGPLQLLAGGMIIFLAYEGFELIANTAADIRQPARNLPRAYFASVAFVIVLYVVVAAVTVGNLTVDRIVAAKDYALAAAAQPFLGHFGFILIAVAAMLSTASAINATLYGAARVSFIIAKDGELPKFLEDKVWRKPLVGLLLTAALTLVTANLFDLSSISVMGSAGFLLIFAGVNLANLILRKTTGAHWWLAGLGVLACLGALAALVWQRATTAPAELGVLALMVGLAVLIEVLYRAATHRRIKSSMKV